MEEKEKINIWLTQNRDQRVKNNEYLDIDQIENITSNLNVLIENNNKDSIDKKFILKEGNLLLEKMNFLINNKRISQLMSVEKFKDLATEQESQSKEARRFCDISMDIFDILYTAGRYDIAIEYLNAIDFEKIKIIGIPLWLMVSSEPISPLMRAIPKEDKIKELNVARCEFYNKAYKYYESIGKDGKFFCTGQYKPKDYEKTVKEYDMIYIGGAPKEK